MFFYFKIITLYTSCSALETNLILIFNMGEPNTNPKSNTTRSKPCGFVISEAYKESERKALEKVKSLPNCATGSCSGCWVCDFD